MVHFHQNWYLIQSMGLLAKIELWMSKYYSHQVEKIVGVLTKFHYFQWFENLLTNSMKMVYLLIWKYEILWKQGVTSLLVSDRLSALISMQFYKSIKVKHCNLWEISRARPKLSFDPWLSAAYLLTGTARPLKSGGSRVKKIP